MARKVIHDLTGLLEFSALTPKEQEQLYEAREFLNKYEDKKEERRLLREDGEQSERVNEE